MINKSTKVLLSTLILSVSTFGQQPSTGNPSPAINWRRGGNFQGGGAGSNIFGTFFNSPI